MTEYGAADRPGHLDIDAVSAFVDRDLSPDDLAMIEFHVGECPACHREFLEIHTTVLLLAGLPQYAPRRSFVLGREHARAARRGQRAASDSAWVLPTMQPSPVATMHVAAPPPGSRVAGWLWGMQAAVALGAILLLVTAGNLVRPQPGGMQFAAPTAAAPAHLAPEATIAATDVPLPAPAIVSDTASDAAREAASDEAAYPAPASASSFQEVANPAEGTEGEAGASQEMLRGEQPLQVQSRPAVTGAAASVTSLVTPVAVSSQAEPDAPTAGVTTAPATTNAATPAPSRTVLIALALLLAWLVVSIVGYSRVRTRR